MTFPKAGCSLYRKQSMLPVRFLWEQKTPGPPTSLSSPIYISQTTLPYVCRQIDLGEFTAFSPSLVKWLNAFSSPRGPIHVFIMESKTSQKFWLYLSTHLCNFSCRNLPFIGTSKDAGNISVVKKIR